MDQLIFASLSHTHYWYEVGMLKVPALGTQSFKVKNEDTRISLENHQQKYIPGRQHEWNFPSHTINDSQTQQSFSEADRFCRKRT